VRRVSCLFSFDDQVKKENARFKSTSRLIQEHPRSAAFMPLQRQIFFGDGILAKALDFPALKRRERRAPTAFLNQP
jgi:hypothetical protein